MGMASSAAIAAAERFERSSGPRLALAVWRRLAESSMAPDLRGPATLNAIRCATATRDLGALSDLARMWESVGAGAWSSALNACCKDLAAANMLVPATELAAHEVRRHRSAHGLYLYARCLDVAGDARASDAFAEAAERAEKEGLVAMARAARIRRVAWLSTKAETLALAIDEAKRIDAATATDAEKLVLARVLGNDGSRFVRAGALGLLDDIVCKSNDPKLRRRALLTAARHADARPRDLSPMEHDRLVALFGRETVAKEAGRAKDALHIGERLARASSDADFEAALADAARAVPDLAPLHRRARDIVSGRFEPAEVRQHAPTWTSLLDAAAALRDGAYPRAAIALRSVATNAEARDRMPAEAYNLVEAALAVDDAEVRSVAGRLASALVRDESLAPPHGWLRLATLLAFAEMDSLSDIARRRAALAKEPGGAEALGIALTRAGWKLAREGDRSRAIAALREARASASK